MLGCCHTCGTSYCTPCCSNVTYPTTATATIVSQWAAYDAYDPEADDGIIHCPAGSASTSVTLTSIYPDRDPFTEEWTDPVQHPCSWAYDFSWPGNSCGDYTIQAPDCYTNSGSKCELITYTLTSLIFYAQCKIGPPSIEPGHVCDGTQEPSHYSCFQSAGSNIAGWKLQGGFVGNTDCLFHSPGGGDCSIPLVGGDYRCDTSRICGHLDPCNRSVCCYPGTYGCVGDPPSDPRQCPSCKCCPLKVRFYQGCYIFDPDGAYTGTLPDEWNCATGQVRIEDVWYSIASLSYVEINMDSVCDSTGQINLRAERQLGPVQAKRPGGCCGGQTRRQVLGNERRRR